MGIANFSVTLRGIATPDGSSISLTIPTDQYGNYSFEGLPPGTYEVSYTLVSSVGYSTELGDGQSLPGDNPAGNGSAVSASNFAIRDIVTIGEYDHVNNDFTLVPLPRIGLGKTVSEPVFQPDGSYILRYTIRVQNHSSEPLTSVTITDILDNPSQLFGAAVPASAQLQPGQYKVTDFTSSGIAVNTGFDGSGTPQLVTQAALAFEEVAEFSFSVQVQPQVPWLGTSTTHDNQAEVTAVGEYTGKPGSDRSDNSENGHNFPQFNKATTVTVTPQPRIELTKAAIPERTTGLAEAGDRINYEFSVTNSGNVPLVDVVLSDPLPGLQDLTPSTISRLAPGETVTGISAHYLLTQADIDNGSVDNTATVTGQWGVDGGAPLTVSDQKSASVTNLSDPQIELIKDIDRNDIRNPRSEPGDIVRYSFTVRNPGNTTLNNVVVSDPLPGLAPDPSNAFEIGELVPGAAVTVYADYAITQEDINSGEVNNTARATGTYGANKTSIESQPSSQNVSTYRETGLELVKALARAEPTDPRAGQTLEWTVTARNTGNVTLYNVSVTDPLQGASISPSSVATLQPGATAEFTVTAPILQEWINNGEVRNTASANFEDPTGSQPPVTSNEVVVPLTSVPSIALKKIASLDQVSTPAAEGDVISYIFTIRNTGNVPLSRLTLVDELNVSEDEVVVVMEPAAMAALAGATLNPLDEIVVRATYVLTQVDINRGSISNMAVATGIPTTGPQDPVEDLSGTDFESDNPTVNLFDRNARIELVKDVSSVPASPAKAGDVVTYSFRIRNTGNVTIENIRIEDDIAGVTVTNPTGWRGPLAPGDENTDAFVASYTLTQDDIDLGEFTNTAKVVGSSAGGTPDDVEDTSSAFVEFDQEKSITIEKTADATALQSPPKAGDVITYNFVVSNTGNVKLTDVVVTDPLPGLVLADDTIDTLLPGAENAVTLTGSYAITQAVIQRGDVVNQANVNGVYTDPGTGTEENVPGISEEITVPLVQTPDIAVIKEQDVANTTLTEPAEAGQVIAYTFTVVNTGNVVLTDVVLDDPLAGVSPNQFTIAELAPGERRVFSATYAITEEDIDSEQVVNQAKVQAVFDNGTGTTTVSDLSGPTEDTDEELIVPVVAPEPHLTILKSGSWNDPNGNGYPEAGEAIVYTFTVTNEGNATLRNVSPKDAGPLFNGRAGTGTLSGFVPAPTTLEPQESQTFTATYVLTQEDIDAAAGLMEAITNTATATGNTRNGRPYESDPSRAVVSLPAVEPSDVRLTKQSLLYQVKRGERVPYVIKVENTSSSNAGPVNVIDILPAGFRYIDGSAVVNGTVAEPTISGRQASFDGLTLGPRGTIEIRLDLLVLSTAGPGKHTNTAVVTDRSGNRVSKDATATVEIVAEPIFDCGEVIGTVFDDRNRNGYQDQGELGLPGVRLATVKGWLITTDAHGRFHVPCAALPDSRVGSNFIMKLDTRTLPTGYRLTTENPRVVRLTAGKMTELNFGASEGRVVRLDLTDEAFQKNSVELHERWQAGVEQLVGVLATEQSVLRIAYTGRDADRRLAEARVNHIKKMISEQWRRRRGSYPLEIEVRVEAGQ